MGGGKHRPYAVKTTFLPLIGGSFDYFAAQNFASRTAQDDSRGEGFLLSDV